MPFRLDDLILSGLKTYKSNDHFFRVSDSKWKKYPSDSEGIMTISPLWFRAHEVFFSPLKKQTQNITSFQLSKIH